MASAITLATLGVAAQVTGGVVPTPGQTRDNRNAPVGAASLTGVVTTDGSGAPVRRARVSLTGPELRGGRSTVTDDEGRFTFVALPAGRFTLGASKAGYVSASYGARSAGRPGTPVQVLDGQKYERMNIQMPRGSVITGIVVDDYGEPAPGTPVRVLRFVMRTGERTLQQAGQDTTDDRGMYRVYGLQPGDYIVSAMPRNQGIGAIRETVMAEVEMLVQQAQAMGVNTGPGGRGGNPAPQLGGRGGRGQDLIDRAAALQQQLGEADAQTVAYAPVFYPGTTTAGTALPVTLAIGEERAAVDFQLQLVQTARIEGTLSSYDGTVPQGVQISLTPTDQGDMPRIPGVGNLSVRPNSGGQFAIANVTPGQYRLQARAMLRDTTAQQAAGEAGRGGRGGRGGPIADVLWASVDLGVSGQNIENVVLALRPGMKVSGRLSFQGAGTPPTDLSGARVTLVPRGETQPGGVPPAIVDAGGQFTINGVPPGLYSIAAGVQTGRGRGAVNQPVPATPATSWTLTSAIVNGREALDTLMSVDPNQDVTGALLTFTDQTQEISGTIQDGTGNPAPDYTIVVYSADQSHWGPYSRRIAATRPATDGRFSIRSLPAGNYRLTAVIDAEPGEWFNPAFLAQLVAGSIPITLAVGEQKVQDIRLAR
ncbi:MAG TPA: carboxypeptidase-like regulatory domain-containing protein [Vicinamibacterales bacterium]|nr:carboxypeptidase-like regulatory domain-containing protein [Vicinamibacterales bacterium]